MGPRDSIFAWEFKENSLSVFEPQRYQFAYKISVSETDDKGTQSPSDLIALENDLFLMRYSPFYSSSMETDDPLMYTKIHHMDRQGRLVGKPFLRLPMTRYLMTVSAAEISVMIPPFSRDSLSNLAPEGYCIPIGMIQSTSKSIRLKEILLGESLSTPSNTCNRSHVE